MLIDAMRRALHAPMAVLAMAALLASMAAGCLCAAPRAAENGAHGCCAGDDGAVLTGADGCCAPRAAASAPVLAVAASGGPAPPAAVIPSPWLDAASTPLAPVPAGPPTSATPHILRL